MAPDISELLNKPTITVDNAAKAIGLPRNAIYAAIHRGEFATIKTGKRILVLTAPLRRKLGIDAA